VEQAVRRWRSRVALADLVLACVIVAVTQVAVWTGTVRGPHLPNAVLLLAVTAPVALKSLWPVGVTVWSSLLLALQVALYGASETAGLMFTFLALAYAVTSRCGPARRAAGLGVLLAAGLWHEARDPDIHAVVDALFAPILIGVGAVVGYAVAQARARAELAEKQVLAAELARRQSEELAAARERERIARELHDVLAHTVSVMVVQAEAAEEMLETAPSKARGPVTAVQRVGREALHELRTLLKGLRGDDDPRLSQPTVDRLDELVDSALVAGQDVTVSVAGTPLPLSATTSAAVFRVAQESLTNARKHAPGSPLDLALHWRPDELVLTATNRLTSTRPDADPGVGLIGMRERVEVLGGRLDVGRDDGIFRVCAVFPVGEGA
jgi:signal transduction histidine kinase